VPIFSNLIIFWFIFKFMHDGKVSWKLALRGSALTSILLFTGQWLIKFYLTNYFFGAHGGVGGTMLVILVWVYYSSQIIFFGAKYMAVYARSKGHPIEHVMIKK
jgi:membrane protein